MRGISKHQYYFKLPPFLREFRKGRAILIYHKLGFPQLSAPNKGLHISPKLFDRQLEELRASGFRSMEVDASIHAGDGVSITFDDGYVSTFEHVMAPLSKHGFSAIQFLSSAFLGKQSSWDKSSEPIMDKAQVRDWLQAGHTIGSHTATHVRLTSVTEDRAREEITSSRKSLEDEFGVEIRHFCYPYGDWNEQIAGWVAEAGYWTASTSDPGVNGASTSPFALKRIHAYVPLRSVQGLYYYFCR